jgi:ATP-dependent RNA helicase RhlE
LVFSRTKHGADKIVRQLGAAGIAAAAIHGNKSQPQRERAIAAFKSGQAPVLIATDIAARGIDIPGVAHVVNFDLPDVPEQYVHRIGRTARAGADGAAIAFCSPDERINLRDIERLTRQTLPVMPLPEGFVAAAQALKALKLPPQREERGGHGRGGMGGGRRDGGHRHGRPAAPRAAIQPAGAAGGERRRDDQRPAHSQQRRDDGPRPAYGDRSGPRQDGQRHPQRAGGHPAHRPEGGAGKRPFKGGRRGGPGRFQRAQG